MSLGRLGGWFRRSANEDPLESRPLLKDYFVTYISFLNGEEAYLFNVVSREVFIQIDRSQHDALELADGKRAIREIAALIYVKHPKRYSSTASAEMEMLNFFQILYENGVTELRTHGRR